MLLIYFSCAWLAGILLGAKFDLPLLTLPIGLVPLALLFWWRSQRRMIILTSLCLTLFVSGAIFFQATRPATDEGSLQFYNDRGTVTVEGVISRPPEVRDRTIHIRLDASAITTETGPHEVTGTALIFVPRYPAYEYGDRLRVTGELKTPTSIGDFDYKGYLATQEIYSTMVYPHLEVLGKGAGNPLLARVFSLRENLADTLARTLAEPQASLAQVLLLGMRGTIPEDVQTDFSHSGGAHLLAISGLHLTILTGILLSLGIWLFGRRHNIHIWLTLGIIWLYALLTGLHPPIMRAAIMVSLFLAAELLGRQRHTFTALTFAAALMVTFTPQLLWQASFQMSFAAMAGLVFISPILQAGADRLVSKTPDADGAASGLVNTVTSSFSATLGAVIAVWPLIAHYFGIVSLAAPLTTLLALPVLPATIVTGFLAAFTGLVFLPGAQVIAWLTWLCLSYLLLVVNVFGSLPLSYLETGPINTGLIAGYYLVLAAALWIFSRQRTVWSGLWLRLKTARLTSRLPSLPLKFIILPLLLLAALLTTAAATTPDSRLHVSFLDVGQGDAILVTHGNQQVLIDGGPSPQALGVELGKHIPFWDRTIELVVLTHPHADHVTGLLDIVQRYQVEEAIYPEVEYESSQYDEWLRVIQENGIETILARAGQRLELGDGIVIDILNPPMPLYTGTESDIDNNSVVLHLSLDEVSFLLAADIYQEAELELVRQRSVPASTVLKVAHHGSASSTSEEFLATVDPQIVVISVGADNQYGLPDEAIVARLNERLGAENIYRTDRDGTIEFITDGQRLWAQVAR